MRALVLRNYSLRIHPIIRYGLTLKIGDPSAARVTMGLKGPSSLRRHHAPVLRFVARSVNQYCHSTVLTIDGGFPLKGSALNSFSTLGLPSIKRSSVNTTHGDLCHDASEANHRFQSKRG